MGAHVERTSDKRLQLRLLHVALHHFREAKICDFGLAPVKQDVRWLQVSVNDVVRVQALEPLHNLLHNLECFFLAQLPVVLFQILIQRTAVAEFDYQINVVRRLLHIDQLNYVLVLQLLHGENLVLELGNRLI